MIISTDTESQIAINGNSENLIVKAGVVVDVVDAAILDASYPDAMITNYGIVQSSSRDGIDFQGGIGANTLINEAGAQISGEVAGVGNEVDYLYFQNFGHVWGGEIGVVAYGDDNFVENSGDISSAGVGISVGSVHTNIVNSGSIISAAYAIGLTQPSGVADIDNSGIIEGQWVAIHSTSQGGLSLENTGQVIGGIDISHASTASTISNGGLIRGDVVMTSGADSFDGRGGTVTGLIEGSAGNDTLIGGSGDDTLMGGAGADRLDGGKGAGADVFVYDAVTESTVQSHDDIAKHWGGGDVIDVSAIDANSKHAGFQAFVFGGALSSPGAALTPHEIQYYHQGGDTFVVADTTGHGRADFEIEIHGTVDLTADSFVL